MVVELTIRDRLMLLQLMRGMQGDIVLMKVVRNALDSIGFSSEEIKAAGLRFDQASGETRWNEADGPKQVELDEVLFNKIKSMLIDMSKANRLTFEHIELYEKFVGE